MIKDEREEDGATLWDTTLPTLKKKFLSQLEKECKNTNWVERLSRGSYKTRFEICKDADGELVCTFERLKEIQAEGLFTQS